MRKDFIKNNCKIDCSWENGKGRWVIKIKHLADDGVVFSPVRVTMDGFESFKDACDEAVKLFKRNVKNCITDRQTVKADYKKDDIWPELVT